MSISSISFGTQLKYKKNYEVQKKDGTPVSKEYCNLTTGFICTDTLIILDSPLCEGVFGSEN